MKYFLLTFFFITPVFACQENMDLTSAAPVEELANAIGVATDKITKKVVDVEVNWDGSGSIHLFEDSKGNFLGLKLSYKGSNMGTLTTDELNKGETIKFHEKGVSPDPLVLGLKSGTTITPNKTEIDFVFKAYIDADKPFFKTYDVKLKRVNGVWKAYKDGKAITKTTLDPKVSWGKWTGKFKSVSFE